VATPAGGSGTTLASDFLRDPDPAFATQGEQMSNLKYSLEQEHDGAGLTGGYGGSTGVGEPGLDPAADRAADANDDNDDSEHEIEPERAVEQDGAGRQ
jgi:hypothetical protein